jgi:hypothetical protein
LSVGCGSGVLSDSLLLPAPNLLSGYVTEEPRAQKS